MADKAISELVRASIITAADLFVLQQDNTAKCLPGQVLLNWLTAAADGHGGIADWKKIGTSGLVDTYRITLADTTTFDYYVTNGKAIASVEQTSVSDLTRTYTIAFNDGTSQKFTVTDGRGIASFKQTSVSGLTRTYTITFNDGTDMQFTVTDGRSIVRTEKVGTDGLVDTYALIMNDETMETITVTNGEKGDKGDRADIWVRYASQKPTAESHNFGELPDAWIGIATGHNMAEAPTDWKAYDWYQWKGEKGDPGIPATLVSSKVDYQVSDSGTIIPSGSWSLSVPVVAQGRYLWTRSTNNFNTGNPVVSYSVSRMGLDGSGSVSSVANISPDADGNVPLTAENVGALPKTGGNLTGELRMNGWPISGLNAPTANDQAANMGYVNQQVRKAAPWNLLANSYFRYPVNLIGKKTYIGGGYTINRWKQWLETDVVNIEDGYIVVSGNGIHQIMDSKNFRNTTYTLAAKTLDGHIYIVVNNPFSGNEVNQNNLLFGSKDSNGYVTVAVRGGSYVWAVLYEGEYTAENLPEHQPKGYSAELAECLRYLRPLIPADRDVGYLCNLTDIGYIVTFHFGGAEMQDAPGLLGAGSECRFVCSDANHVPILVESLPVELYTSDKYSISLIARKEIPVEIVEVTMDTKNNEFEGTLFAEAEL